MAADEDSNIDPGKVTLWEISTGKVRASLEYSDGGNSPAYLGETNVMFSLDGKKLAVGTRANAEIHGALYLWDLSTILK